MLKRVLFAAAALILFVPALTTASSSWQSVGTLTTNPTVETSVAVDSQGIVYFAYTESADDGYWYVSIDKYEEGTLTDLGSIRTYGEQIQIQIDSSDTPYLAYYAPNEGVVVKTLNGSSWDNVGNVGSQGIATAEEYPVNIQFAIAPDDTLYLAYGDDSSTASSTEVASIKILEYTGNTSSDTDGNTNDGWEYALAPFYSVIGDFSLDVDDNGVIYLVINIDRSADISGAKSVVYMTYAYRWSGSGWSSILDDPYYPHLGEFYVKANQDGFDFFDGEETQRYVGSTDSWTSLGDATAVADTDSSLTYRNYSYRNQGTQYATDSDNTLFHVFGNTDTDTQDWDNPWGSATVAMYNGSSWELIGSSRFSETSSMYFSLAVTDDEYLVLCRDGSDGEAVLYAYDTTTSASETTTEETPAPTNTAEETTAETTEQVAETTNDYGTSPVTGELEKISAVSPGQFIRSYSFNSIYYVGDDMKRHPFWGPKSFFTYADSFDEVIWVTDATLSTMTIGTPMLPKAGVVLVKIQSDPKVYAIDENKTLRWVPDEETAITLYGSSWSDYVIDLQPTIFANFTVGDDMTTSTVVDRAIMKTRATIAAGG